MAKVGDLLKAAEAARLAQRGEKSSQPTVEEARKRMLEAREAPKGLVGEVKKNLAVGAVIPTDAPVPEVAAPVVPEPVVAEPVVAPVAEPVAPAPAPQVDRFETSRFVGEIRQANGQWLAEIVYKTGGGIERFEAATRKDLLLKVLEGKANATLKVREVVRREKYGTELDKVYTLPDGLTNEMFAAMPEPAQRAMIETIATQETMEFRAQCPEFYGSDSNSEKIQKFLFKRDLPLTVKNLEYAFGELMDSEELEIRPTPKVTVAPSVPTPTPKVEDSAPVAAPVASVAPAAVAPAAPVVQVRKRGTTGLQPGQSSAGDTELDQTEDGNKSRELSEAELRALPMSELRRQYRTTLKPNRRF